MITRSFEYLAPKTVKEAVSSLTKRKEAKVLAGGQSLVPLMNLGVVAPPYIVDITRLKGLSYIQEKKGTLNIGALTTHEKVETSSIVKRSYTLLADAAETIGDPQIRHRGTIGGATCHADPAGDFPPSLMAVNADFVSVGPKKTRRINSSQFFLDVFTTALKPNEILTEIKIPKPPLRSGTAYAKLEYISGGFAIVGIATALELDNSGNCKSLRVAGCGATLAPILFAEIEKELVGRPLDEKAIEQAGEIAFDSVKKPLSDIHAEGDYRRDMLRVFTKRSIRKALSRIGR